MAWERGLGEGGHRKKRSFPLWGAVLLHVAPLWPQGITHTLYVLGSNKTGSLPVESNDRKVVHRCKLCDISNTRQPKVRNMYF